MPQIDLKNCFLDPKSLDSSTGLKDLHVGACEFGTGKLRFRRSLVCAHEAFKIFLGGPLPMCVVSERIGPH